MSRLTDYDESVRSLLKVVHGKLDDNDLAEFKRHFAVILNITEDLFAEVTKGDEQCRK